MNSAIRKFIFGDAGIKEYATVTINNAIREKVYLETVNGIIDISQNNWLLCLDPVVFGIWIKKTDNNLIKSDKTGYQIYFKDATKDHILADLRLTLFDSVRETNGTLILLKLVKCKIYHINFFKAHLLFHKFYKKPKLSFNQLKGFASSYSYPRRVRIISFRQGNYYNIFPMDLLGAIPQSNQYVFGLRHTNTALPKIVETKKLVVSEISFTHKDVIYKLGSHHVTGPPPVEQLPFKVITSKNFGFYVPAWVDNYKEISITKTINLGSHMLMWGTVQYECILKPATGHLYHIHYLLYLYHKRNGFAYPAV